MRIVGAAVAEHLAIHIENTARDGSVDLGDQLSQLRSHLPRIHWELQDFIAGRIQIN